MPHTLKKGAPYCILLLMLLVTAGLGRWSSIGAVGATPATSVTVSNQAPTFNTVPHESPTSDTTTPTDVDTNVVFKATATDANGDGYYLAVCKTNAITVGAAGAAPTCASSPNTWGVSTLTTSASEATVTYGVTAANETAQNYAWYAFVCDNNTGGEQCTTMSNGGSSGNNGTPFEVNHRPSFTADTSDSALPPGSTTMTITASTYNDTDTDGAQDTVTLYVCKSAVFTGSACTGGEWCHATATPTATLACDLTIPNPQAHGTVAYYPYVVDSHALVATGGKQGASETYSVSDVAPSVTGTPTFNGVADISLTGEKTTTNIVVTGVATDDNGCGDLVTGSTYANAWLTSFTNAACVTDAGANANKCYFHATCTLKGTYTCDAWPDKTADYTCTIAMQYYADPTDAGTPWASDTWTATFIRAMARVPVPVRRIPGRAK